MTEWVYSVLMSDFDYTDGTFFDFDAPGPTEACLFFSQGKCSGGVTTVTSRSGMTTSNKCQACQDDLNTRLDAVARRYPDSATAPSWFDPTYAGERWDSDY